MTSPGLMRTKGHGKYRFISGLATFSALVLSWFLTVGLEAASVPTKKSDAELSQGLIGSWEMKLERKGRPFEKVFISFDSAGKFKLIQIADVVGHKGRLENQGKWSVTGGKLVEDTTNIHGSQWNGVIQRFPIVSLQAGVLMLGTRHGDDEYRRASIPSQLPPVLPPGGFQQAFALVTPKPEYPYEVRRDRIEGKGVFELNLDEKTGAVRSVGIFQSTGHKILDDTAIKTLRNWRFKPETGLGFLVPVNFKLTRP